MMNTQDIEHVVVSGISPGSMLNSAGTWTIVAMLILALVKAWPVLAKLSIEARAALRQEKRADISDCQKRLDAMDVRLDAAEERAHQIELKLVGALAATRILDAEVVRLDPNSAALSTARAVLTAAFAVSPSTPPDMAEKVEKAI